MLFHLLFIFLILAVLAFLAVAMPSGAFAQWSVLRGAGDLASFESTARPTVAVKPSPDFVTVAQGKMTVALSMDRSRTDTEAGMVWYCLSAGKNAQLAVALADAVHQKCLSCHEDLFAAGAKGCASCHAVIKVRDRLPAEGLVKLNPLYTDCAVCHGKKAQELVPGRMDAFHGQCMTCHRKVGKGPFEKTQCGQCHTK